VTVTAQNPQNQDEEDPLMPIDAISEYGMRMSPSGLPASLASVGRPPLKKAIDDCATMTAPDCAMVSNLMKEVSGAFGYQFTLPYTASTFSAAGKSSCAVLFAVTPLSSWGGSNLSSHRVCSSICCWSVSVAAASARRESSTPVRISRSVSPALPAVRAAQCLSRFSSSNANSRRSAAVIAHRNASVLIVGRGVGPRMLHPPHPPSAHPPMARTTKV